MRNLFLALLFLPFFAHAQVGPIRWRVDANIAGANPDLGTSAVSSYTGITNGSLTLTNNTGTGTKVLTAQIPCSTTVTPSGTTCSSGTESVGVAFTPPGNWKGDVSACVTFSHRASAYGGSNFGEIRTTFQIVETPNNAQTISQEGKSKTQSGLDSVSVIHYTEFQTFPHRLCGNFTFSTTGQKVLRLFYEQTIATSANQSIILADQDSSRGQIDIHWEVYPLNN